MDVEKDINFMETSQGCKVMLSYRIENDVIKNMTENIESELFDHMARMRGYRRGNEIENDVEYVCITGCSELDGVHCNAMGSSINDRRAEGCDYCKCGNQETWIEADCFDRLARGLVRKASRVDVAALQDTQERIDDDATLVPSAYCDEVLGWDADDIVIRTDYAAKNEAMIADLLRRQRELDAKTMGGE